VGNTSGILNSYASPAGGLNFFANPFSSAIDFDAFYNTNSAVFGSNNYYNVWDDDAGNYLLYTIGSGGGAGQYIPVGGGFFSDVGGTPGNIQFLSPPASPHHRVHQNIPLYKDDKVYLNRLVLHAEGNYSRDEMIVHFMKETSNNFVESEDLYKWPSMADNATEAWMTVDGIDITLNRPAPLQNHAYDVPVGFRCHKAGTYTITASGIESFNNTALIWIEDTKTGGPWYSLVDNPVYSFSAVPEDSEDRFILHFFGSQSIEDPVEEEVVKVYTYDGNVYILNRGNDRLKEYMIYDPLGRTVQSGSLDNSSMNRIRIADSFGYFIVKIISEERIYTGKILISR